MYPAELAQELNSKHIVLASSSKTKGDLLRRLDINFTVYEPTFEENLNPNDYTASEYVEETALGKVLSVERLLNTRSIKPDIIIGADTMVEHRGKLYGKPHSSIEAFTILNELTSSNVPNVVYTGVVIKGTDKVVKFVETTKVFMEQISWDQIRDYANSPEPYKYAGGYGIQGVASSFIRRIEGDYNTVIGLPLCRLKTELKKFAGWNEQKPKPTGVVVIN